MTNTNTSDKTRKMVTLSVLIAITGLHLLAISVLARSHLHCYAFQL